MVEEAALARTWEAGREAWPALAVSREELARFLAGSERVAGEDLAHLHAGDVYLACACAAGAPGAIDAFEKAFGPDLDRAVRRLAGSTDGADVGQMVRERLFVARPGQPAKISLYSGRAPLRYWVRVVAQRTARSAGRKRVDVPAGDALLLDRVTEGDAEEHVMRAHLRQLYKTSFERAFAGLAPADRSLLRLHYLDRMGIDAIGRMLHLHRASAARRIATTRERLRVATEEIVRAETGLTESALESAVRLVRDELDLSIERVLGGEPVVEDEPA
jgi:RNA polymerase sigma-70 factor (ECF subfamily)